MPRHPEPEPEPEPPRVEERPIWTATYRSLSDWHQSPFASSGPVIAAVG